MEVKPPQWRERTMVFWQMEQRQTLTDHLGQKKKLRQSLRTFCLLPRSQHPAVGYLSKMVDPLHQAPWSQQFCWIFSSSLELFKHLFHCVCACPWVHMCHCGSVKPEDNLKVSLLSFMWVPGLNSCHWPWQQAHLPSEPPCNFFIEVFCKGILF